MHGHRNIKLKKFECRIDFRTGALLEYSPVFKNDFFQICTSVYSHAASRATKIVLVFNVAI